MTLPRPVLIALLGVALCAAAFLATRSANDTNSAVTTVGPAQQPAPTHKATTPAHHPAPAAKAHKPAPAAPAKNEPTVQKAAPATTPAPAQTKPATPAKPTVSPQVAKTLPAIKALARGDVVVFFFTRPGPADDTGTRAAVHSLKGEKGVSVFTVGLNQLETFGPVLNGAGVSQVPAVVVVRAGQKGRLLQGFIDSGTLHQTVADARR
jgi:cytoskeletal protein RodZ